MPSPKHSEKKVAQIVRDAGGQVIGRTRLQKLAFLLEISGLGDGFEFEYRHYGPYSEDLADAAHRSALIGLIEEKEKEASWGGFYSVFKTDMQQSSEISEARKKLSRIAADADAIELELAATAAFLAEEFEDPWEETANRKPQKAAGRIEKAKELYAKLSKLKLPTPLPNIV